ncbi:MAG: hypothetical protein ACP5HZ_06515 [Ferrimicrobium sp.]
MTTSIAGFVGAHGSICRITSTDGIRLAAKPLVLSASLAKVVCL